MSTAPFLPRCVECRRGLAMRILSVKCVHCDKMKEKSGQIFIPYERSFILVFWEKECLVGATASTWNFGSTDPRWSEIADLEQIIACSASAVTQLKKLQLTLNRKLGSPLRAFQMSLRWSSYVAPKSPKGAQKRKTAVFPLKSHFASKKSAQSFFMWKLSAANM